MNLTNNGQQSCVCGQQHLKFVWINNGQQHLKCIVVLTLIQQGVVLWSTASQMCVDKQTKHKQWSTTSQMLSGKLAELYD